MRNLLNPRWIFILNTLPICLLFFIMYGEFSVIKSLLDEEALHYWKIFGGALAALGILNLLYGVFLIIRKQNISIYYPFIGFFSYLVYIYMYAIYSHDIIPRSVPSWMVSENIYLHVGTFLMPVLVYYMFVLVVHFTSKTKEKKAWKSFLMAIAIPTIWFIISLLPSDVLNFFEDFLRTFVGYHGVAWFVIIMTLLFLFLLIRSVYILTRKKGESWKKYHLIWEIPITILLPLLGLAINNGLIGDFRVRTSGVFGDFNSYWFYILVLISGLLICLPNVENKSRRLFLFVGRSITFSFTFYFFLVFLPFLPLSIFAIVAFGAGFLMLSPLVLFVLHVNKLIADLKFLKHHYGKGLLKSISIIGFLIIPCFLIATYVSDRNTLEKAIDYVYNPDYSKSYDIDKPSLQNTLNIIHNHKRNNWGGIFGSQQPYLSNIFNWIVLDNMILSDAKLQKLDHIFFGTSDHRGRTSFLQNKEVEITDISSTSTYVASENVWKSWIDLEISNHNDNRRFSEYATTIALPEGAWISDYYLYVGDEKEMGILAEKKAAMWVFSNIRRSNRDPGILYYLTGNKVAFRVFPFLEKEIRRTGFEILHKEPFEFTIDNNVVQLGDVEQQQNTSYENEDLIYVSIAEKQQLKEVQRSPYFHFVLDVSDREKLGDYTQGIDRLVQRYPKLSGNAKISFVDTYVSTFDMNSDWKVALDNHNSTGGFYIDRGIKSLLFHSYKEASSTYPIIVTVTDEIEKAIFENDFSDWDFAFPEFSSFYNLYENDSLGLHSLLTEPAKFLDFAAIDSHHSVLEYKLDNKTVYLPNNDKANIILKSDKVDTNVGHLKEKDWNTGIAMQGIWKAQIIHPQTTNDVWLDLVKQSFTSRIMTPVTSYLVVENEAQKAIFKKKQEQVLSGNKAFDLGEDAQRMSEPNLIVLSTLFAFILLYRHRRKERLLK